MAPSVGSAALFASVAAATLAAVAKEARPPGGPQLALRQCDFSAKYQTFILGSNPPTLSLTTPMDNGTYCIDIEDFSPNNDADVRTWPCGSGSSTNQYWTVTANSIQSQDPGKKCLTVQSPAAAYSLITTNDCSPSDPLQQLRLDASTGRILHVPTGLCVDADVKTPDFCQMSPQSGWTICNPLAPIDDRVADIVGRLSLADKISALGTATPALGSVGLPAYNWWSEAAHGIAHVSYDDNTPYASNTVLPITASQSFNRSLWTATGNQIGREARAFMNVGNAYSTFWAPVINIGREPRWGRNVESVGEDPLLTGQYAINWVKGFQHAPEAPSTLQAAACCKHFVANELDGWNGTDRHHFDANVSMQDLQDSYFPPFQACAEQGNVAGFMCSYNAVNGVPSCANDWLLSTVLRGEWGFDGYVTSDCDADKDVYTSHFYETTPELVVRDVLRAGTDVDCGGFVTQYAGYALGNGTIVPGDIDTVLSRLFRVLIRLGRFDPPGPLQQIPTSDICSPYALELARDGARQGTVLLKNTNGLLPLAPSSFKKAAVIGPNFNLSKTFALYYAGQPCNNSFYTLVDAVANWVPATVGVAGLPSVTSNDTSGFAAAVAAAAGADVVVLALGNDRTVETEGRDRDSIDLFPGQQALVAAIVAGIPASTPIVAVTMSGGMIDVSSLLSNPRVGAILHAGQPSVQVLGVSDLIFGKGVPAARMSQTTYSANFVNEVSMFDFNMRPGPSVWPPGTNPGRTYRFYTGTPVLPFGYGLSFTSFTYTPIAPPATLSLAPVVAGLQAGAQRGLTATVPAELQTAAVSYWVNVTNTGSVDADDVVLGFLVPPGAGTDGTPLQQLFGFERVHVPAGQTVSVYLGAQGESFTQVDAQGTRVPWPGRYTVRFGVRETAAHGQGFAEVPLEAAL